MLCICIHSTNGHISVQGILIVVSEKTQSIAEIDSQFQVQELMRFK